MTNLVLTNHARFDRAERLSFIIAEVGIGEYIHETVEVVNGQLQIERITSTGVLMIFGKDGNKEILVTGYFLTVARAYAIYRNEGHSNIPPRLYQRIIKNAAKYKSWF